MRYAIGLCFLLFAHTAVQAKDVVVLLEVKDLFERDFYRLADYIEETLALEGEGINTSFRGRTHDGSIEGACVLGISFESYCEETIVRNARTMNLADILVGREYAEGGMEVNISLEAPHHRQISFGRSFVEPIAKESWYVGGLRRAVRTNDPIAECSRNLQAMKRSLADALSGTKRAEMIEVLSRECGFDLDSPIQ